MIFCLQILSRSNGLLPSRATCAAAVRLYAASASKASSTSTSTTPTSSDIVKGPSLLRTSVHRPRPSLLHLPGLRSLPLWTRWDGEQNRVAYSDPSITSAVEHLQDNWSTILDEYQRVAPSQKSDYQVDTEHSLHKGLWDWYSYMLKGELQGNFGQHFPETTKILQTLRDDGQLFEGTPFGYAFFSTLHKNSRISAHSAPMNLRVRVHLPLVVPAAAEGSQATGSSGDGNNGAEEKLACGIRIGPHSVPWIPGQALVLDDSYDHEVWNETSSERVLLLVDLWHPDVTMQERRDVIELFQHAKREGWWSS